MTELALPVAGAIFVFGVVLPAAALLAKGLLWLLQRRALATGLHGQWALRYAALVGATALPLGWIISACLQQAEAGTAPDVCILPDPPGVLCPEVAALAVALAVLVALSALPRLVRERGALSPSVSERALAVRTRIARLACGRPRLERLSIKLVVTEAGEEPIATHGVFGPRVVVDVAFAEQLDDAALVAALEHEAQHVSDGDPLRYLVAFWALAANPLGRWLLEPELARWIVAREVHCDREAVLAGASAPALAQALVTAARFGTTPATVRPGLGTSDVGVLQLRVGLLLAYADSRPRHCCRAPALRAAACALLVALAMPHQFGSGPLDALHRTAEDAATYLAGK